jgi:3-deoxy-D-manno-octulosonate 8-phosphate phosphatase (KDO 8-P phosphatase)
MARVRCLLLDVDGVMTDGRLYYTSSGEEYKAFHVRDGSALVLWRRAGGRIAIVSGRSSPAVARRASEVQADVLLQGVADKRWGLIEVCRRLQLHAEEICAIGDDWLDMPVLRSVGVAVAPADATSEVRQSVDYVTVASGGAGVVREVVEWLLKEQGKWDQIVENSPLGGDSCQMGSSGAAGAADNDLLDQRVTASSGAQAYEEQG